MTKSFYIGLSEFLLSSQSDVHFFCALSRGVHFFCPHKRNEPKKRSRLTFQRLKIVPFAEVIRNSLRSNRCSFLLSSQKKRTKEKEPANVAEAKNRVFCRSHPKLAALKQRMTFIGKRLDFLDASSTKAGCLRDRWA